MITIEKLREYCKAKGIAIPNGCRKEVVEAAIVRAALHQTEVKAKGCFGFWENEDSSCITCDHEKVCAEASLGMDKEQMIKSVERIENPRIRFEKLGKRKKAWV